MTNGVIDRKNQKFYTYLSKVFHGINNAQKQYNWLITDCECYPKNKEIEELFDQKYCWLSGEELTDIVVKENTNIIIFTIANKIQTLQIIINSH